MLRRDALFIVIGIAFIIASLGFAYSVTPPVINDVNVSPELDIALFEDPYQIIADIELGIDVNVTLTGINGDGGVVDGGIVGIVDIGHWLSETAIISIPFSDMLTGLTRDDGSRIGALFSFAVPRYVILIKLFILFFILLLLRRKKKEKGAGKKKKIDKSIKRQVKKVIL